MAIEKTPSKNWELTLYEMQRTPQPLITDDSEIAICPLRLSNELKCPICLDFLNNTMATKECLHRFCAQCIVTALRSGNKECPACRKKLVSKRSLRHDHNFDAIIAKLFPYRKEYEAHQANVMAKQIKNSVKPKISQMCEPKSEKVIDVEAQQQGNTPVNPLGGNVDEESTSSKDQSNSTASAYPPKYRNTMKYLERTSLALQSDNNSSAQTDEEMKMTFVETSKPHKRVRQSSSESGGPETNCSSSITSELCSLIGTQSRDGVQSTSSHADKPHQYSLTDNAAIDIVLEPLDGRSSKNKLNESFVLQVPDVATAGHLMEFLNLKKIELQRTRKGSSSAIGHGSGDSDAMKCRIIDEVTYNIFLAITTNEKKPSASASIDPNRQGTSSSSLVRTNRKSMNKKLESSDKLLTIIAEYSIRQRKNKKDKQKKSIGGNGSGFSSDNWEFTVFYYQEVSLKAMSTHPHDLHN